MSLGFADFQVNLEALQRNGNVLDLAVSNLLELVEWVSEVGVKGCLNNCGVTSSDKGECVSGWVDENIVLKNSLLKILVYCVLHRESPNNSYIKEKQFAVIRITVVESVQYYLTYSNIKQGLNSIRQSLLYYFVFLNRLSCY